MEWYRSPSVPPTCVTFIKLSFVASVPMEYNPAVPPARIAVHVWVIWVVLPTMLSPVSHSSSIRDEMSLHREQNPKVAMGGHVQFPVLQ